MCHVSKTTPLLGVICYTFGKTICSPFVQTLRALASAIPEIWMGPKKFTSISANADGPRDAALQKIDNIVLTEYNYQAMSVGR